jgi:hypothetical protein
MLGCPVLQVFDRLHLGVLVRAAIDRAEVLHG